MNKNNVKIGGVRPLSKAQQIQDLKNENKKLWQNIAQLGENNKAFINMLKSICKQNVFKKGEMTEQSLVLVNDNDRVVFYDGVEILQQPIDDKK